VDDLTDPPTSLLSRALEAMVDGVVVADTRRGTVHLNRAARRMLGLPADTPVTTAFLKDRLGFYPFDLVAAGGGPVREEIRIDGARYHSVITPIVDDHGAPVGGTAVLRDLGDAPAIRRQRAELATRFGHQLRTPLTSVAGALDLVLAGNAGALGDKQRLYVEMARNAAARIGALTDELVDAARVDGERPALVRTRLDVGALVRDVVARYGVVADGRGVRLETRVTAPSLLSDGDGERLAQVLGNLLSNAVKFAAPGGAVDVEVFAPPGVANMVGVSVSNDGDPIPADERERIFDPFETSGRRVGGSGLGLGISRAIVEAHGGRIWVEAPEVGARFVLTLPTAQPVAEPASTHAASALARILVVEPERHGAYVLKGLLMTAGHQVEVAHDADAALHAAREQRPQVVVLSCGVPDAAGLTAILLHDPDTRGAAVVAVGDDPELAAAGATECLARPVRPDELLAACQRALADLGRHRHRVLVVDHDPSIRAICRDMLEQAGYAVRDAGSADAAIAEARRFRPDLVLLDVLMPGFDGFGSAEALRADPATRMTPVIFLSARSGTDDKVRAFRSGAEDYVVKPFDAAELVARVGKSLARQARERAASPTTQLPGADAIEAEVVRRLQLRDTAAVCCHLDLDNLKAFNDYYGYAKADAVVRQTADLVRDVVRRVGSPGDFIGHIAGDDFVLVCDGAVADRVCAAICARFDQLIPLYYHRDDRARGYIEAKDRYGTLRRFPVMSVSIAAVTLAGVRGYADVAMRAIDGRTLAKSLAGSAYVRDGAVRLGGEAANDEAVPPAASAPGEAG
jgi:signal transduction histidine kinase/DNA-binding response OmpR family regulator